MPVRALLLATLLACLTVGACSRKSPCEPVQQDPASRTLGIVLDGGRVCSDEAMVITIDYPETETAEALRERYRTTLPTQGWAVGQGESDSITVATRDERTLIIIAMDNRDRGVPTAIIRY